MRPPRRPTQSRPAEIGTGDMFDFAALPPDINSARMYSGPGSGPMLAAAAAWNTMAAEMRSAAADYDSVVTQLTSAGWHGPSSESMLAAAEPYLAWLNTTATEAQYAEMWAQDAAAMNGYATASSTTTQFTPFGTPQSPTNEEGVANQTNTVAQAA